MAKPSKQRAIKNLRGCLESINFDWEDRYSPQFRMWRRDTKIAISRVFGERSDNFREFCEIDFELFDFEFESKDELKDAIRGSLEYAKVFIESMIGEVENWWEEEDREPIRSSFHSKKVFVVHGHDESARESVSSFLKELKLEPIILHEQPNKGRPLISKFEDYTDVGFAVVLLTPDDIGRSACDGSKSQPRARQNVILELGFFLAKLGRERVCPLKKGNVEIPSDYDGVAYVPLDEKEDWKIKLIQELTAAGIDVDKNVALVEEIMKTVRKSMSSR